MPKSLVVLGAAVENDRHRGEGDHIVDDGGLAEQALNRRQRRLEAHLAALAFQRLQQRGLLAADVGAGAQAHFEIEALAAAQKILTQVVRRISRVYRRLERNLRVRVLPAQIDVAPRGAGREPRDRHALDQHEGIALHQHAIGERARIALIGIADDVFLRPLGPQYRLPLDSGREGGPAAAAKTGGGDSGHDLRRRQVQGRLQPPIAVVLKIVGETARISEPDACKRQALLALEVRNLGGDTLAQGMCTSAGETGFEQSRYILRPDRSVGEPCAPDIHFHQGFEPQETTRAVALKLDFHPAPAGFGSNRLCSFIGTHAQSCGVTGNKNFHDRTRICATSASNRCGVTRPFKSSSIINDGPRAQLPKQYTGSKLIAPSAVVP